MDHHPYSHNNIKTVPRSASCSPIQNLYQPHDSTAKSYAIPTEKTFFNLTEFLTLLASFVCLAIAVVAVAPLAIDLPTWFGTWFGYTRQIQLIGVLLTGMNKCFLVLSPKFFYVIEARWGRSTLQNYDAILRNSVLGSCTSNLWRANLAIFLALPVALSISYKEPMFKDGVRTTPTSNPTHISNPYYGLAGPPGLENDLPGPWGAIGVSYMTNASIPWFSAVKNNTNFTPLPKFPAAYGFNTLILSNTSAAMLDIPMPDYISALQAKLAGFHDLVTMNISAVVHGTVTSYNSTVQNNRYNAAFWDSNNLNATNAWQTGPYGQNIALLSSDFGNHNGSWCVTGFHPINDGTNDTDLARVRRNALGFNTRRELCNGKWSLSRDKLQLISGYCGLPSSEPLDQSIYLNPLDLNIYYPPFLNEYLARFAAEGYNSTLFLAPSPSDWDPWLVSSFATVLARSRTTARFGYFSWDNPKNVSSPLDQAATQFNKSEIYYPVNNEALMYQIPVMTQDSWLLYLILAIQPALCLLIFLLGFIQYDSPLDSNFGLIAILAGVRPASLPLLKGASISGKLEKPLPLTILTEHIRPVDFDGKRMPQVEFELDVPGVPNRNECLPHPWFETPTPKVLSRIKDAIVKRFGGRLGTGGRKSTIGLADLRRSGTAYERL